jgi:hypothetical protein
MVAIGPDGTPIDLGALGTLLRELRIDHVIIEDILAALDQGTSSVQGYEPDQVPTRSFGTLEGGQSLAHHTALARQVVVDTLTTMAADLGHFDHGVRAFRRGFNVADEHAEADLAAIAADVSSIRSTTEDGWAS